MSSRSDIILFETSDGLTPQQIRKLNYNFQNLQRSGLSGASDNAIIYANQAIAQESTEWQTALDHEIAERKASDQSILELVKDLMHPVGSTYITFGTEDPNTMTMSDGETRVFAGTWQRVAQGKMLIGAGTDGDGDTFTVGTDGGEKQVTLTADQSGVPAHNHPEDEAGNHRHVLSICKVSNGSGTTGNGPNYTNSVLLEFNYSWQSFKPNTEYDGKHTHTIKNNTAADAAQAHNNMSPYTPVNIWKRTA